MEPIPDGVRRMLTARPFDSMSDEYRTALGRLALASTRNLEEALAGIRDIAAVHRFCENALGLHHLDFAHGLDEGGFHQQAFSLLNEMRRCRGIGGYRFLSPKRLRVREWSYGPYSGGLDSTMPLDALVRNRESMGTRWLLGTCTEEIIQGYDDQWTGVHGGPVFPYGVGWTDEVYAFIVPTPGTRHRSTGLFVGPSHV